MQLGSAAVQTQLSKKADAHIMDLLLDPKKVIEVGRNMERLKAETSKDKVIKYAKVIGDIFLETTSRGLPIGLREATTERAQREQREE